MKDLKESETSDFVRTIVSNWNNKLVFFDGKNGRTWIARVRGSKGDLLLMETKNGELILDSFDNIKSASLFRPSKKRKEMVDREEVS